MEAISRSTVLESIHQETINGLNELKQSIASDTCPPLPDPWEEYFSDTQGIPYYYNPLTGESSWERPVIHVNSTSTPPDTVDEGSYHSDNDDDKSLDVSQITASTSSSRRVEDSLLQRGEEYALRREDLRRKHEEMLSAENTGRPQLSRYTEKLYSQRGEVTETIAERSKRQLEARKAREESLRREMEEREARELRPTPAITKKSQRLHQEQQRGVAAMLSWEESRRERMQARQQEAEAARQAELTLKPTVSKNSDKILKSSGRRDPEDGMTVEERLLEYEERKRLKHIQAVQRLNMEARQQAAGSAATSGSGAVRRRPSQGDVSDRLYRQASQQREQREMQEYLAGQRQESFKPRINKTSAKLAQRSRPQNVPVEELLSYRGQLYSDKAQRRQQMVEQEKAARLKPKMNPNSVKILQQTGGLEADRLTQPIGAVKQKTLQTIEQPSFQPTISRKSRQIYASSAPGSHFEYDSGEDYGSSGVLNEDSGSTGSTGPTGPTGVYMRSQKWLQDKEKRMAREKAQREQEELSQCSFRPTIRDTRPRDMESGDSRSSYGQGMTLAERQAAWQRKRDMKMAMERREKEVAELAECSFAPAIGGKVNNNESVNRHGDLSSNRKNTREGDSPFRKAVPAIGPRRDRPPPPPSPPSSPPPDGQYMYYEDYGGHEEYANHNGYAGYGDYDWGGVDYRNHREEDHANDQDDDEYFNRYHHRAAYGAETLDAYGTPYRDQQFMSNDDFPMPPPSQYDPPPPPPDDIDDDDAHGYPPPPPPPPQAGSENLRSYFSSTALASSSLLDRNDALDSCSLSAADDEYSAAYEFDENGVPRLNDEISRQSCTNAQQSTSRSGNNSYRSNVDLL